MKFFIGNREGEIVHVYQKINATIFVIMMLMLLAGIILDVSYGKLYFLNCEIPRISNFPHQETFPSYGITRAFVLLMHGQYDRSLQFNSNALNLLIFILFNSAICMFSYFRKSRFWIVVHPFLFLVSYFGLLGKILAISFV
jgi:hypothetical protein